MKQRITLLFCALLSGCSSLKESSDFTPSITYDYEDFEDRSIAFNDLFNFELDDYFVYIYSKACGHCENIKQQVLAYFNEHENIYALPYLKEIPISDDVSNSIGASSIENVSILGTPTLFRIKEHVLILNIAGESKILNTLQDN